MTQRSSDATAAAARTDTSPSAGDDAPSPAPVVPDGERRRETGPGEGRGFPRIQELRRREPPGRRAGSGRDADDLEPRLQRLERQNRWLRYLVAALCLATGLTLFERFFPEGVIVQKTIMESKELKLLDSEGNARLFLRMYSRVPVLQILDSNGKPRMSLGLRFDDTPFLDLSDKRGNTRATLEMTEDDLPALRLFDESGEVKFQIN